MRVRALLRALTGVWCVGICAWRIARFVGERLLLEVGCCNRSERVYCLLVFSLARIKLRNLSG